MRFSDNDAIEHPAARREPPAEAPRSEPEIIPPGAHPRPPYAGGFVFTDHGTRVRLVRLGPVGIAALLLAAAALGAIGLVVLLGAALVGAVGVAAVTAAALLSRLFGGSAGR